MNWVEWIPALIGGAIIGIAASLLLLIKGKIFGVSGIFAGALFHKDKERSWKIATCVGLLAGAWMVQIIEPTLFHYEFKGDLWMMVVAGLLVGFGTRLGSGCTSGHGICGLPRLSPRSLVAVMTFMFTGAITVYLFRHVWHLN